TVDRPLHPFQAAPGASGWTIRATVAASRLAEHAFALFVNELLALPQRDDDGVIETGEALGAHEPVLLDHAVDLLRDDAAGLVLTVVLVGRGGDREPLVLDLLGRLAAGLFRAAAAAEKTFQE